MPRWNILITPSLLQPSKSVFGFLNFFANAGPDCEKEEKQSLWLMGIISNLRGPRTQEGLPVSDGLSSSSSSTSVANKKKWSNLMPLFVVLVVVAEIAFLCRLDMAKNTAFFDSWPDLFYKAPPLAGDLGVRQMDNRRKSSPERCEEWLERADSLVYSRDFNEDPIIISGSDQVCSLFALCFFYFLFFIVLSFLQWSCSLIWFLPIFFSCFGKWIQMIQCVVEPNESILFYYLFFSAFLFMSYNQEQPKIIYCVECRSGELVQLVASLFIIPIRILMLPLLCNNKLE